MDAKHSNRWGSVVGWFVAIFIAVAMLGLYLAVRYEFCKQAKNYKPAQLPAPQVHVNLKPLQDSIDALPNKVLQSITGSANTHKGALGELIGYIQLRTSYDRIIPLGNIVDFVGIKFSTDDSEGRVDFIDIKTGDKSRLSKDQRALQNLIKEKKIGFVKLKVETDSANTT